MFRDGVHKTFADHEPSARILETLKQGPTTAPVVAEVCGIHPSYATSLLLLAAAEGIAQIVRSEGRVTYVGAS